MDVAIYALNLSVAGGMLFASILRWRRVLHPHVLFATILVALLMSDFVIRGYAPETVGDVATEQIYELQAVVVMVCFLVWFLSFLIARRHQRLRLNGPNISRGDTPPTTSFARAAVILALSMLFVEWGKRLYFSDGSIEAAVLSSFGPRGGAPWISRRNELGNLGDQFAFLDITNIVLPLAGVLFAYILTMTRVMRSICLGGWLVVLTTLIADGNRTPVVAVLGMSALFYVLREKRWAWRLAGAAILAIVAAAATSAMYLFRSEGWGQLAEGGGDSYHIMYHQDDNYRQALLALERSLNTNERWSPLEFAYVIAVNPIPRAMWSEKPALLADYWGNYKNEWTTITFVGELVAMFGFWAGIALSVPIALLAYLVISASARLLERPGGLIVYMLMALYGYMVLRSLLNISQFIYLPAAALAALWILSPFSRALDRRDGYRALPS